MTKIPSILVVDDQVGMLETFTDILGDKGYKVATASDGYTAIDKVKKETFDVIFMDIKMPGINGVQTFREIKKVNPKTAVIMMTAYSVEDLVKEAIEEGAYTVIYKPFDIDRVVETIERVLKTILILVVDDSYGDRETLKDILEDKGYKVVEADSGYKAIELVKNGKYDIIFLDVKLPDIDGVKTFEEIHKINPEIPVVMITGYSVEELVEGALKKGVYACITKPLDVEKILKAMDGALKGK
ncbi:MAG: response regulator [Chlamydiae bacterium]|nr:response regulator [Chlamydiota bacterium]MBI3276856.1 response regulator [Chlamydiota bacterium]